MSEELKPCPACGASRGLYVLYDEHDMEWFVFCDNCKTSICNERNDKREDAVRTWNSRAERTCRIIEDMCGLAHCSECGYEFDPYDCSGIPEEGVPYEYDGRYCKNCGAKVLGE